MNSAGVGVVPLAQMGDDDRIDRDAAEIVQQHPAMRRRIGADALEARQVVVVEPVGEAVAVAVDRAVIEHPPGGGDHGRRAEAELGGSRSRSSP